jgi:hypothetical protein
LRTTRFPSGMLDTFSIGFEIMPGTAPSAAPAGAASKPLEQDAPAVRGGE